jgi:hypothetical protein
MIYSISKSRISITLALDKYTLVYSNNNILKVDNETKKNIAKIRVGCNVNHMSLSNDKSFLLIACRKNQAKIADLTTNKVVKVLKGHTESVTFIIPGNGTDIITSSLDKTVKIWNSEGECLLTHHELLTPVGSMIFSQKKQSIFCNLVYNQQVVIFDYSLCKSVVMINHHFAIITHICWIKRDEVFGTCSLDGQIIEWNVDTLNPIINNWRRTGEYVIQFIASADGRYVFFADTSSEIGFYDRTDFLRNKTRLAYQSRLMCNSLSISPNGKYMGFSGKNFNPQILKIDPPFCSVVIQDAIFDYDMFALRVFVCQDGRILDSDNKELARITTTLSSPILFSIADYQYSKYGKDLDEGPDYVFELNIEHSIESTEWVPVTFYIPQVKFVNWVDSIYAIHYTLSLPEEDRVDARFIKSRYQFDQFQIAKHYTGPFGLRLPKNICQLIGNYLFKNL